MQPAQESQFFRFNTRLMRVDVEKESTATKVRGLVTCGLREVILVLEKDLLRWVNVSRTIQKVWQWPTVAL